MCEAGNIEKGTAKWQPMLALVYGLFIHFCGSNHEVTRMQQEKKKQHQRAKVKFMLMKI